MNININFLILSSKKYKSQYIYIYIVFVNDMFPLIAIAAFFILGIAFFAIGKDDFGIKRVKEVSNDNSVKETDLKKTVPSSKNSSSNDKKELVSAENSSEIDSGNDNSD